MTNYQNQTFRNQNLVVDGNRYEACSFNNCGLLYQGGELPVFDRCAFQGMSIQLGGAALSTVRYLSGLHQGGLVKTVEATLTHIEEVAPSLAEQVDAEATGTNWGRLGAYSLLLFVITGLLAAALHYSLVLYPRQVLEAQPAQPLSAQIPLELMPVLPDELASQYDSVRAAQLDQAGTYGWVDRNRQIARIPVSAAMDLLLENEGFPEAGG